MQQPIGMGVMRMKKSGEKKTMSARFWLTSAGIIGCAGVLGLTLGAYVVSTPADRWDGTTPSLVASGPDNDIESSDSGSSGPGIVSCQGCGPTLAERQHAADMAGLDVDGLISGTRDPVVRDYLEDEVETAATMPFPSPPPRLPAMAEGLAAGEAPTQPPPLRSTVAVPDIMIQPVSAAGMPAP